MYQRLSAEFLGTAVLSMAVLLSVNTSSSVLTTPILAALVLGLFVYSIGNVSGCHINPAVTLGLWSVSKISSEKALQYIVAQVLGALVAFGIVAVTVGGVSLGLAEESGTVFLAELIGTAIFTFGIASVAFSKVAEAASGLTIGGSLLLGITLAVALGSSGILNPAVGLALGATSISYVAGSIIGAMLGMYVYRAIVK
jgi:glycerol uptake facilitator-like aquaporin